MASKACASGIENEILTFGEEKFAGERVKISGGLIRQAAYWIKGFYLILFSGRSKNSTIALLPAKTPSKTSFFLK